MPHLHNLSISTLIWLMSTFHTACHLKKTIAAQRTVQVRDDTKLRPLIKAGCDMNSEGNRSKPL